MAWYKNGTVSVVSGSATVSGSGTVWLGQIKTGDIFTVDRTRVYEVLTVSSDTSLTLAENYAGSTASGQTYAIMRNFTDTLSADVCSKLLGVMNKYDGLADVVTGGGGGGSGTTTATLTRGNYLTGGNFNGATAQTWAVDAASANTAGKVVVRDGSGNFAAGTITATLNGNATTATTATKLSIPRLINGVAFDGSQNITIGGTSGGTTTTTVTTTTTAVRASVCGVMVPFYIYPANVYTNPDVLGLVELIKTYRNVPTCVIINPSNGPGTATDGNYSAAIKMFKAAGATVVGYVSTAYAATIDATRTEAAVKADVDSWALLYANTLPNGIFYDEMPYENVPANVALYKRYNDYAHGKGFQMVVGNPGTNQQEVWFSQKTADVIVCHETGVWPSETDMRGGTASSVFAGGHMEYPTSMRAILVYGQASLDSWKLRRFRRFADWIYCTNDVLNPNPWDSLPPYLSQLYADLADQDGIGQGPTFLTSGASIAWDASETAVGAVTLGTNATMAAATNMLPGRTYTLVVTQDGTGSRTLNFNSTFYKFTSGVSLPLSGTAGQRHVIEFLFNGTVALAKSVGTYPA